MYLATRYSSFPESYSTNENMPFTNTCKIKIFKFVLAGRYLLEEVRAVFLVEVQQHLAVTVGGEGHLKRLGVIQDFSGLSPLFPAP